MELKDIKTLTEVAEEYNIPPVTLRKRLDYKSYNLIEGIDFKKLGARMPILLSPSGIEKIIKKSK